MNITHENEEKFKSPVTLSDCVEMRKEFDAAFSLDVSDKPRNLDSEKAKLHYDIMEEELNEYFDWAVAPNHFKPESTEEERLVETADALGDELYVLLGKFNAHGLLDKASLIVEEIHKSNMSKLDEDGKPIINHPDSPYYDPNKPIGKVVKGPNYFNPNLKPIIFS